MKLREGQRRAIALVAAILAIVLAYCALSFGGDIVVGIGTFLGAPQKNQTTGREGAFYVPSFFGLLIATALSIVLILWEEAPRMWQRATVTSVTLLVLIGVSAADFANDATLVRVRYQVAINLMLIAVGTYATLNLIRLRALGDFLNVLRSIAIALIVWEAVLIPSIYSLIWALRARGISVKVGDDFIAITAVILSTLISVLSWWYPRRSQIIEEEGPPTTH